MMKLLLKQCIMNFLKKRLFKNYEKMLKLLIEVEEATDRFNELYSEERIYDSQEYLIYKDTLNMLSIDPDRKDTTPQQEKVTSK